MSTLTEVLRWASSLPAWQSDAVRRLSSGSPLTPRDYEDLLALLKSEHGIADPEQRSPVRARRPEEPGLKVVAGEATTVKLASLSTLTNVNALHPEVTLTFGRTGLTVIYGDNGAGKSGYTRFLKKVCRARDAEPILPNVDEASVGLAAGRIAVETAGKTDSISWTEGDAPPPALQGFAVFDTRCAGLYLDQENDFCFQPAGLEVLERLAELCAALRAKVEAEIREVAPKVDGYRHLVGLTAVGRFLGALGPKSTDSQLEELSEWGDGHRRRHEELCAVLDVSAPEEKARHLRAVAQRVERLREQIAAADNSLADEVLERARQSKLERAELRRRNSESERGFWNDAPPPEAAAAWKTLFEAAREFALVVQEEAAFKEGKPCLLCAQPLGPSASSRLEQFDQFMRQASSERIKVLDQELHEMDVSARSACPNLRVDVDLLEVLEAHLTTLGKRVEGRPVEWNIRLAALLNDEHDSASRPLELIDCDGPLASLVQASVAAAEALEAGSDPKARAAMVAERDELVSRRGLSEVRESVRRAIQAHVLTSKLEKCLTALRTNAITAAVNAIVERQLSVELATTLNEELALLELEELQVELRSRSVKGEPRHKLVLARAQKRRVNEVLSEGQQRALALAAFFAEVRLSGAKDGVVFDDPVSSLDHQRRENVARRLAREANERQVIVFTHDIYFLFVLLEEAARAGALITTRTLRRDVHYGVPRDGLPFDALSVTKRLKDINELHQEAERAKRAGREDEWRRVTTEAYSLLRMAWERAVEEVLLREVVVRFRKSIETNRLSSLSFEDDDWHQVESGMSKCSNYVHDKAALGQRALPTPVELKSDIDQLKAWVSALNKRADEHKKRRATRATPEAQPPAGVSLVGSGGA